MSANTFTDTAKKRDATQLEKQRRVDAKMAALHAERMSVECYCIGCKRMLPKDHFGVDKSRAKGCNSRCKPCKLAHGHKNKCGRYEPGERDPNLVPPRSINVMSGIWVPPRGEYVRNDGNKHIKSLGF